MSNFYGPQVEKAPVLRSKERLKMLLRLYSRKANSNLKQAAQNHNNFFLSDRTIQTKTNSRTFYFCSYKQMCHWRHF